MCFKKINTIFPFRKLLLLLLGLAVVIQIIVISYNHISGYYVLDGYNHFFLRLIRGTLLSLIAGFLISYPDLYIINYLNMRAPWGEKALARIPIQLSFAVFISISISTAITLFANWLSPYTEDLRGVLITNASIYSVVNILMIAILEAGIYFNESARSEQAARKLQEEVAKQTRELTIANTQLLKLQKENLQSQFDVLKQQVNPHFLFNSLNVLTSLIKIDPDLAESFTERLSLVYRYVLENKEKDLVSLSTELEFLNSYLFLLEIRFMGKIITEINIENSYNDFYILPIALQLLIENAVKHNTFSKVNPLKIEIFVDRQQKLNIVNNLNLRETKLGSTGVGLENISRRYALVSEQQPEFTMTKDHFIARLPLLKSEKTEKQH